MTRALAALHVRTMQIRNNDRGATAVEYGLMVALIAVAIIGAVTVLGTNLSGLFTRISGRLTPLAP